MVDLSQEPDSSPAPDDRRGDVAAAIESLSGGDNAQTKPQPAPATGQPGGPGQTQTAPGAAPAGAGAAGQGAGAPASQGQGLTKQQHPPAAGQQQQVKPPQAWKPEARELWPQVPPRVQQEIARWNTALGRALHESEGARQFQGKFDELIAPYRMLLQQEGPDPLVPYQNYLKVLTELRTGTAHNKAASFANLVQHFGIDVSLLDAALAAVLHGGAQPRAPAAPQGEGEFRDPRVDTLLQRLQETESQSNAAQSREVATELQEFERSAEFYEDLREDMADILELATKRGQQMSLKDAYDRACKINQDVANILSQRELDTKAASARQVAQRARGASLSVHGAPTVPDGAPATDGSRRGDIEAAIAQLSGRQ